MGNIIDPFVLIEKYGAEALRYYLMSEITTGRDADFDTERLHSRYDAELANIVGNLVNRTVSMARRFTNGSLNRFSSVPFSSDHSFAELLDVSVDEYRKNMKTLEPDRAWEHVVHLARMCNLYIEVQAPWKLAKKGSIGQLEQSFYGLHESLRIIAILLSPVLPRAAHGIFDQLNWKMDLSGKEERFSLKDAEWGKLPDGHVVGKPVPLFPRIETSD